MIAVSFGLVGWEFYLFGSWVVSLECAVGSFCDWRVVGSSVSGSSEVSLYSSVSEW